MSYERLIDTTQNVDITDFAAYLAASTNTVRIPANKTVSQNLIIPAACSIQFVNGTKFSYSTYTIEFVGHLVNDPMHQIFDGTGAITFHEGSVPWVRPEWWGVDYTVDCTNAVQAALDSLVDGGIILLSAPLYTITGPLTNTYNAIVIDNSNTVASLLTASTAIINVKSTAIVEKLAVNNLTASKVVVTDANKNLISSDATTSFLDMIYGGGVSPQFYSWDGTWRTVRLDYVGDLLADKTFTMANKTLTWNFTNPAGGMAFNFTGAASGHSLAISQTGGNPGTSQHLLHIEAEDPDPLILHLSPGSATSRAVKIDPYTEMTGPGRLTIDASGKMAWGNGTDAVDVSLERYGVNTLFIDGNVGIGTTNIYAKLHVRQNQDFTSGIHATGGFGSEGGEFYGGSGGAGIYASGGAGGSGGGFSGGVNSPGIYVRGGAGASGNGGEFYGGDGLSKGVYARGGDGKEISEGGIGVYAIGGDGKGVYDDGLAIYGAIISSLADNEIFRLDYGYNEALKVSGARLYVENSIGIRTDAPTHILHVKEGASGATPAASYGILYENSSSAALTILSPDLNSQNIFFGSPTQPKNAQIRSFYNSGFPYLQFFVNTTEKIRITSDGDVGIGVTVPISNLEVKDTTDPGVLTISGGNTIFAAGEEFSSLQFRSGDASILSTNDIAGKIASVAESATGSVSGMAFYTADGSVSPYLRERMRLTYSGRMGIGITNPAAALDVIHTGTDSIALLVGGDVSAASRTDATRKYVRTACPHYTNAEEPVALITADSNGTDNIVYLGGGTVSCNAATSVQIRTGATATTTLGTTRVTVDSAGYVGIGTTIPNTMLDINSNMIRLRTAKTPSSSTDTGSTGQICWDTNYLYVCYNTNQWGRIALLKSGW